MHLIISYLFVSCYYGVLVVSQDGVCLGNTCGECLSYKECGWCEDQNRTSVDGDRCAKITDLEIQGCKSITKPESITISAQNERLTDGDTRGNNAVQIQPQAIHIRSTPNYQNTFTMKFRAARNYPVDLYFLFDLSNTMKEHKNKLASLGGILAREIRNISTNFRFGFGYFQDKVTLPYSHIIPAKKAVPCDGCVPAFGYRHKLQLTENTNEFTKALSEANVTGNIDMPEGGFDAIMQTVACEKAVGWRKHARRLIIYASDSTFHYAGDGKLAGIVLPNDGECHLDKNGANTEELKQDYPSIGQISQKVKEKNVNIIFAIIDKVEDEYTKLSEHIPNSVVGVLEQNSDNVVDIIKTNYEAIISEVEFNVDSPEGVETRLYSDCNSGKVKETSKCGGLSIGKEIEFQVRIAATRCPKQSKNLNRTVTIQAEGMPDKLEINLEVSCECGCEKEGQGEPNSERCSKKGRFSCGICICNEERYGNSCQCDSFTRYGEKTTQACIRPNDTMECMGRGRCICGACDCNAGYTGKFCECDSNACERTNGKICGGPIQGLCPCEKCLCLEGYTGSGCECPLSLDTCYANDGTVCNGKGMCHCGKCECESGYIGKTCESCPTCPGKCVDNRDCVECRVFEEGSLTKEECDQRCSNIEIVETIRDLNGTCQIKDIDGCEMIYRVMFGEEGNVSITAQKFKVCPQEANIILIVSGVIGGILGVGIVLLILWKILTSRYDSIEYAKFNEEVKKVKFAQESNPIYKGATSSYKNPLCEETLPLDAQDPFSS